MRRWWRSLPDSARLLLTLTAVIAPIAVLTVIGMGWAS